MYVLVDRQFAILTLWFVLHDVIIGDFNILLVPVPTYVFTLLFLSLTMFGPT
jgi:hypothetical protein